MDQVFAEQDSIFEDWSVPHGAVIGPGPAPGIKRPVRVPTSIKQEMQDDTDNSGAGVVEHGDGSEQVEEVVEEDVNVSMGMPHLTANVGPQQPDSAEDDGVGGKSEGQEEQEVIDPQYWQRKFDNLRGQFFAPPPPPQAHFPVTQQLIPPMPALPHPLPYSNQHQQFLPNPLQKWYGNIPFPSTFPSNGPQFGDFGGFSGFRPQFGHAPLQGSSSTALKTPAAVLPTSKGKRKTLKEQLSEAQDEIASLRSHPISHGNFLALQNESSQKDALIQHLQDKLRQSEEVTKKATEEKNEAEKWKGSLELMLTGANEALKKMNTEKEEKNEEIENLKRELDAEKKNTEEARKQMKNFQEEKESNENKLKDALLKLQEKNTEQVREIEDFKKVNKKLQNGIKTLEEEEKKLIESYDKMNAGWEKKVTDMEETHRKKLEEMTGEYQSALEGQKKENEELMKERDELKKNKAKLEVAKKKLDEEKRNLEETLMDQVNENKNLEMDRDAGKRKNKDLIDDHAMKMDDLVRDHQSLLEDLETRREVLENERSELKKLNFDLEAAKEELEEEKRILELKVQDQENEKQQLDMERDAEKRKFEDLAADWKKNLSEAEIIKKSAAAEKNAALAKLKEDFMKEKVQMLKAHEDRLNELFNKHEGEIVKMEEKVETLKREKEGLEGNLKTQAELNERLIKEKEAMKADSAKTSAELAEKTARRLQLISEFQKLEENEKNKDPTSANPQENPEEEDDQHVQKEEPREDGEQEGSLADQQESPKEEEAQSGPEAPPMTTKTNERKSRRRGEAVDVTEPPARRQHPKVNYSSKTKKTPKEEKVKK